MYTFLSMTAFKSMGITYSSGQSIWEISILCNWVDYPPCTRVCTHAYNMWMWRDDIASIKVHFQLVRNLEADASGYSFAKAVYLDKSIYWQLHCQITTYALEKYILRKDQVPENVINSREASGKNPSCLSQSSFKVNGSTDKHGLLRKQSRSSSLHHSFPVGSFTDFSLTPSGS